MQHRDFSQLYLMGWKCTKDKDIEFEVDAYAGHDRLNISNHILSCNMLCSNTSSVCLFAKVIWESGGTILLFRIEAFGPKM